jgi:hypothetical protein
MAHNKQILHGSLSLDQTDKGDSHVTRRKVFLPRCMSNNPLHEANGTHRRVSILYLDSHDLYGLHPKKTIEMCSLFTRVQYNQTLIRLFSNIGTHKSTYNQHAFIMKVSASSSSSMHNIFKQEKERTAYMIDGV